MMIDRDDSRIAAYYDALVDRFGHSSRACDASSQESLDIRYRVLGDVADMTGCSVLEVGCGFGDLGAALLARYPNLTYRGIDISARMIEVGRRDRPGLDLGMQNVLDLTAAPAFDYVIAQGIFYLIDGEAVAKTAALVGHMFGLARRAVAFTAISSWGGTVQDSSEHRVEPLEMLSMCRAITPWIVMRHDYHPADVAMYLYKERQMPNGRT